MKDSVPPTVPSLGLGLRLASWTVFGAGLAVFAAVPATDSALRQTILTDCLGVFFVLLLLRIGQAAVRQRARRGALVLLLIGVLLWAAGSAFVNASGQRDVTKFPRVSGCSCSPTPASRATSSWTRPSG